MCKGLLKKLQYKRNIQIFVCAQEKSKNMLYSKSAYSGMEIWAKYRTKAYRYIQSTIHLECLLALVCQWLEGGWRQSHRYSSTWVFI